MELEAQGNNLNNIRRIINYYYLHSTLTPGRLPILYVITGQMSKGVRLSYDHQNRMPQM